MRDAQRSEFRPFARLARLAALPLALVSCQASRTLRVTSEPSQAEVRLDGARVGTTPCEIPFEHYGVRRVAVYLPGFRSYSRSVELSPPWYGQFPFDIVSEVILPLGWSDTHVVHVKLVQGQPVLLEPDLPGVLERADKLRHAGPEGPAPIRSDESEDP